MSVIQINIPSSWDDITVGQYDEIIKYNIQIKTIQTLILALRSNNAELISLLGINDVEFDNLLFTLSIICNIDLEILEQLDTDQLTLILTKLSWLKPIQHVKKVEYNFKSIKVGKWIDLEMIIKDKLEEKIGYFLNKLLEKDVKNEPITKYYALIGDFLEYRKNLFEQYKGLFDGGDDEDEDETAIKSSEELYRAKFNDKWNWYSYLFRLAGEDILKMEAASELNFIHSLTHYSFILEKSRLK